MKTENHEISDVFKGIERDQGHEISYYRFSLSSNYPEVKWLE